MRTISIRGKREEDRIDSQIERAKIYLCLSHFQEQKNTDWLKAALLLCERNNGYLRAIVRGVANLDEYLLSRERFCPSAN